MWQSPVHSPVLPPVLNRHPSAVKTGRTRSPGSGRRHFAQSSAASERNSLSADLKDAGKYSSDGSKKRASSFPVSIQASKSRMQLTGKNTSRNRFSRFASSGSCTRGTIMQLRSRWSTAGSASSAPPALKFVPGNPFHPSAHAACARIWRTSGM